jgi:prevent-host-death family protein
MDIEVGTLEAKNRLSELLAQVEKGQHVYITRRGKRVALLTSASVAAGDKAGPVELLARFRRLRKGGMRGPESLKALVEQGRH